jgi:hypothetical protein
VERGCHGLAGFSRSRKGVIKDQVRESTTLLIGEAPAYPRHPCSTPDILPMCKDYIDKVLITSINANFKTRGAVRPVREGQRAFLLCKRARVAEKPAEGSVAGSQWEIRPARLHSALAESQRC